MRCIHSQSQLSCLVIHSESLLLQERRKRSLDDVPRAPAKLGASKLGASCCCVWSGRGLKAAEPVLHQTNLHFPIKDVMDLRGIPHTALEHAAGNGMCVPAVAFAMLVAVLALQPKI